MVTLLHCQMVYSILYRYIVKWGLYSLVVETPVSITDCMLRSLQNLIYTIYMGLLYQL